MEQVGEIIKHQQNEIGNSYQNIWLNSERAEIAKAAYIVSESQNAYGKNFDVKNFVSNLEIVLGGKYKPNMIVKGIISFIEEYDGLPTPAGIKKQIEIIYEKQRLEKAIDYPSHNGPLKKQEPANKVNWSFMAWKEFTDQEKQQLASHIKSFDCEIRRLDYIKYLINMVGVPKSFIDRI